MTTTKEARDAILNLWAIPVPNEVDETRKTREAVLGSLQILCADLDAQAAKLEQVQRINRELVEALEGLLNCSPDDFNYLADAARLILAKKECRV